MTRQLLSVPEARKPLGISRAKLYKLISAGEIRSVKIGTRRLIPADAIDDYIRACEGRAAGDAA